MKKIVLVLGMLLVIFVGFSSVYADFIVNPPINLIKVFPNAPSDLTVQITYDPNNTSLNKGFVAGWTDNSLNENGFVLQRKQSGVLGGFLDVATTKESYAFDDNVVGGKTYIYRVKAYNAFGDSNFSNEFTILFPAAVIVTAAPTNLTVTFVDDTLLLNWVNHETDSEYFNIERSESGLPFVVLTYTFISNYTDNKVKPGIQYVYRVNAGGLNGNSAYSNEVSTQFQYIAPTQPSSLTAGQSAGIVSLSWTDNSDNEDGFTLERKEVGGSYAFLNGTSAGMTSLVDNSGVAGKTYIYRVKAISTKLGDSIYSNEATVIIPSTGPIAPSKLTAGQSAGIVSLSWTDNSTNEDGFTLERKEEGGTYKFLNGTSAGMTSLVDNSTVAGKTYIYRVKAISTKLGDSLYSNEATVVIPSISPIAPSKLNAGQSAGIVSLSWTDNSTNEDGFTLERKEAGGAYKFLNGTSAGMTSLVDNSAVAGKTYTYRVKAISTKLGDSLYSNEVSLTIGQVSQVVDFSTASGWAVVEIQKAMDYKLTTDKVLSGFNEKITREAFCEVAVKLYEAISGKKADPALNPFTDTSNSEILKAYQLGIVKGITASNFKPSNSITRQEICVMMLRTLKAALPNGDYNPSGAAVLADEKKIASWALDAVKYMNKNGIMNGTGGNNISPEGNTTKEQAIALIKRLFEKYQ